MANKKPKGKEVYELEGGMPHSPDTERTILGSILLDNLALMQAVESRIRPDDFSIDANRKLFLAMCQMHRLGKAIDIVTLVEHIGKRVAEVGGASYIASLTNGIPHRVNIASYCEILKDRSNLRRVIASCNRAVADSMDLVDSSKVISDLEHELIGMVRSDIKKPTDQVANDVFQRIMDIRAGNIDPMGLTSSIPDLDELTRGANPGEFIILAGRTGHGKSSLARQMAWANAVKGKKVSLFVLEMSKANTIECLAATISGVNYEDIRDPRYLSHEELDKVAQAIKAIKESTLDIDDSAGLSDTELAARIRSAIMNGAEMVIVDYMQMVHVVGVTDPRQRVTAVSATLRDLAKTTGVPIVGLSQLKRPEQGSENREPTVYDLKESGDLENDAFQVWLIFRPKERDEATGRWVWTGEDWIIVGKQRNGPPGNVTVTYRGSLLKFEPRIPKPSGPTAEDIAQYAALKESMKFIQHTPIQEELPSGDSASE